MANWSVVSVIHRALYRATGGRVGARLGGLDMLLLSCRGRKSGELRTVPLACMADGADRVVVGSNNGQDSDPAWWLNLQANPEAQVRLGRESWPVRAELATPDERARLWPLLCEQNRFYSRYESQTSREMPVVILRRTGT